MTDGSTSENVPVYSNVEIILQLVKLAVELPSSRLTLKFFAKVIVLLCDNSTIRPTDNEVRLFSLSTSKRFSHNGFSFMSVASGVALPIP